MHKNSPLIGSAQAAKILGISRATFNRRVVAGEIPAAVEMDGLTGARLFDVAVIDELATKRPDDAAPEAATA